MTELQQGLVVAGYGSESVVQASDNGLYRCLARRRTGRPVCGDQVEWTPDAGKRGTIERLLPRRNELTRTNYRGQGRVLAANLDCLMIVVAPEPQPDSSMVDRYLVLADSLGVEPLLIMNKSDLLSQSEREHMVSALLGPWTELGYASRLTSTIKDQGLDDLTAWVGDRIGILVGQSGVGKSSLINALLPDRNARTQALSETSGQGKHTTTETTLYPLRDRGALMDSPGIRILRLGHLSMESIAAGFREFHAHVDQCQYRDCSHRDEPGCAVRDAVARGSIHSRRLASYHVLLSEIQEARPGKR